MRAVLGLVFGLALGWVLFHGVAPVTVVQQDLPPRPCVDRLGTTWRLMRGQATKNGIVDEGTVGLTALVCRGGDVFARHALGDWHRFVPPRMWLPAPAP